MRRFRVVFFSLLLIAFLHACAQDAEPAADPEVRSLLEDMVAACEQHAADTENRYEAGIIDSRELNLARIKLLEARIRLAEYDDRTAEDAIPPDAGADEAVLTLLEEMVAVREEDLANLKILSDIGRASPYEVAQARIRLSDARVRLAEHQNDGETVVNELESQLEDWAEVVQYSEHLAAVGREASGDGADAKVGLLEAKIRLRAAKKKYE
jgi:outer membrane protein TolC